MADEQPQEPRTSAAPFGGEDPVQGARDKIFNLLRDPDEEVGEIEDAGESGDNDPAPEAEEVEAEVERVEEAPEAGVEAEGDDLGEQADEVEAEERSEDSELDLSQTLTVKVDGEEQEVTLEDLRGGYMRQAAFTRKTQEVAEQRRQVQEVAENLQGRAQEYAERLSTVEQVLESLQPEKPDPSLRESNPAEYAERLAEFEERQGQIEQVQAERERVTEEFTQRQQALRQQKLAEERELLEAAIPELVDPDKAEKLNRKMAETAQSTYGFSPEELSEVTDHRAIRLLHDAMQFQEMQAAGEEVTAKKRKSKQPVKPGSTTRGTKRSKKTEAASEARKRLAKSGRVGDAAKALEGLIEE